ncbi:Cytochrome P450 E-class group I protein [Dioscorea alata]|uniref:Cytochrome P450 E-class group I protein n=1 Tax=Dioscorea alata TaxID=55571 RepID=A0ACB7WNL2_DIOAL|nr:Cytochrome P450 E-class group I protein [Dioscorea alata]
MTLIILTLLLLPLSFFFLHRRRSPENKNSSAGSLSELLKNTHRILDWTTDLLAGSPTSTITTFMATITSNPSNVEHILKSNFPNYPKGSHSTTILSDLLGAGIFNSDGELWRLQRKTASLEFTTKTIRSFIFSNVHLEISRLLSVLHSFSISGEVFDLQELLDRLAFDNVCQVTFGHDPGRLDSSSEHIDSAAFAHAFERATVLSVRRFAHPFSITWKLLRFFNLSYEKELKAQVSKVHAFAMQVVHRRKSSGELGDDLLSRFISESSSYSDEFLRDIIVSFVLAGRDTTSATLTWFFYLISIHPEVKTKLLDELRAVRARGAREGELTVEQVKELNYMHAALSETLRLYPPVPLQTRACAESDEWPDGTKVKKGRTVMYSAYAMGRSERIWGRDWEEFRPERWMEEGEFRVVNAFRFPVFHAGPRMCLGKEMAYVQMKTVVAAVMERFEIEVVGGEKEKEEEEKKREVEFTMILRMKGGLPVRVRRKTMMMDGTVEL